MKTGCGLFGAGKCILIATFDESKGHTSAGCNNTVGEVAKHLLQAAWPSSAVPVNDTGGGASGAASWEPYIKDMLLAKGNIAHALICSKTDGTMFANTPGFTVCWTLYTTTTNLH